MGTSRGRLLAEIKEALRATDPSVKLVPERLPFPAFLHFCSGDNLFEWRAEILGPPDSPYQDGTFTLSIKCPPNFPMAPPSVKFKTPTFHPNINFHTGEVCMDVLKAAWSPAWTLACLCHAIISLLADPNPDSPLNCDAGNLIRHGDMRGFRSMAKMYTAEYAVGSQEFPNF